jgi:hypothetical protein
MPTLHIEHAVFDFDAWKRTFDSFADQRAHGGVRRYRVSRPVDDPCYAIIDLDFDETAAAQAFLAMLRKLWEHAEGKLIEQPRARIVDTVEQQTIDAAHR